MNEIQRIADRMKDATSLENIWEIAHAELKEFGVTGIFYGQLASVSEVAASKKCDGLMVPRGLLSKTSYSASFLSAFDTNELIENDPTVSHCLLSDEALVWGYDEQWADLHPWYRKRYEIERDLGYHKGCTIPSSHFSNRWVGGMGVAMTEVPDKDFEPFWRDHQRMIIGICGLLDSGMRNIHSEEFVGLSAREKECLTRLAAGYSPQQIAHKMNVRPGRIERLVSQAKRKLHAKTRDHAVARALMLNIIQP